MNSTIAFLLFVGIRFASILACDLQDTEIGVCVKDVETYCKNELFPYTVQSILDSRDCLRKNRDFVSKACLDYLELDKPSIIESCLEEMKTSCSNVVPGCFNIRSCLSGVSVDELSPICQDALLHDQENIGSKANTLLPAFRIAVLNNWTKYVFTFLSQVSKGSYLRGSMSIEIIGNDEEGSIYLSNDIKTLDPNNNNEVDNVLNDDESVSTILNDLNYTTD